MKKVLFTISLLVSLFTIQAQWTQTAQGGSSDIIAHKGKLFALTVAQKLVVSNNNGDSWTDITTDTLSGRPDFVVSAGNRLYVATYNNFNAHGLIYYSTDEGLSWALDTAGMPNAIVQAPGKADVRKLFVYNGDQLVANFGGPDAYCTKKTTEAAWVVMTDLASLDPDHYVAKGDSLLAFGSGTTLKYSTNMGQSFTDITGNGLPNFYVPKSVYLNSGKRIYLGVDLSIQGRTALYYSDDFGSNWDSVSIFKYVGTTFTGQRQNLTAIYSKDDAVYMALYNDQSNTTADVFRSADAGQSFVKDTVGLKVDNFSTEQVLKFYEHNGRLFSVHNNTDIHYKSLGNTISLLEYERSDIEVFPNPTTGIVHFSAGVKSVELFAISGKRFFVAVDESSTVDLSALPKGIYLFRFVTTEGTEYRKKLLIH